MPQPELQQYGGHHGENQQKHYFDSIETDEFVMPPQFEVEIRMQDNQVSEQLGLCCRSKE